MGVAVTAYSACNGLGRTHAAVLEGLASGRRGLFPCPLDVPFSVPCGVVGGELPELRPAMASYSTRQARLAVLAFAEVEAAVQRAIARHGAARVGLVLGTSTGGLLETEPAYFHWREHGRLPEDYAYATQHPFHVFAEALREHAGIAGPCYVVSTACSSSAKVFASARRLLRSGRCDAVLVGGVDSLCLTTVRGFHSLGVAASEPCRPFSAERIGMNVGEGAALVLLERLAESEHPIARLLGIGESSDAFHMSSPDPEGRGAARAMRTALADAGLTASQIDYINAHGTGTLRNDSAEALAIAGVFGNEVPVVSTKSYTGHMLGAGSATEAVFSIMAIQHQFVPANLDLDPVDPAIALRLPRTREDLRIRHVMSNSFAFGGSNVALVFGEVPR